MASRNRKLVVDSDVLVEILRGNGTVADQLRACLAAGVRVWITPITVAEILAGARSKEAAVTRRLLDGLGCLRIDRAVSDSAGRYIARYGPSHGVEIADALIAAATRANDCRLWTRNRKHYPMRDLRFFTPGPAREPDP